MSHWHYYNRDGEMVGPLTPGALKELVKQGVITRETVLENSEGRTAVAKKVKGLTFPEAAPPPITAPQPVSVPLPPPLPAQQGKPKRKNSKGAAVLLFVVGLIFAAYIFRGLIGDALSGYRRGLGAAILTYKNRSYEGVKWKEVRVSQLADDPPQLHRVVGWQDGDYWVIASRGILRYKNGTWTEVYRNTIRYPNFALLLTQDAFLLKSSYENALLIRSDGAQTLSSDIFGSDNYSVLFHAENGLLHQSTRYGQYKISFTNIETLGDQSTKSQKITDRDKEYLIHTSDNIATKKTIHKLHCYVRVAPGKYFAIADDVLAEFRNGMWYKVAELPSSNYRAMWIDCSGSTPKNAVLVRNGGYVTIYQFGKGAREMSVPDPQSERTSRNLFRVWGNSIDKLWTMDTDGTIWEKDGNNWRVIVRGLQKDSVTFRDAWVSPTGTIYAITDHKLYQLK